MPVQDNRSWRRNVIRMRQLDEMARSLKTLRAEVERDRSLAQAKIERAQHLPGLSAGGSIVNVASVSGILPSGQAAAYCASKAAIGGFAQALRLDLADQGIRVTEIVAGRVQTDLYRDALDSESREAMYADGELEVIEPVSSEPLSSGPDQSGLIAAQRSR